MLSNNSEVLFELVRAGLWETEAHLSQYRSIDFNEIIRLSEEQSVVGLVAAGIEHVVDLKLPQAVVLQFVGQALQIEQRNTSMNKFIGVIVDKMRDADIYSVLVKGQGVAQCYERPQWRSAGDIDFLLSDINYKKAIDFYLPLSSYNKNSGRYSKEYVFTIRDWMVELHGSLRTGLSGRVDKVIDEVQKDVFDGCNVRSWDDGGCTVFLPAPDNDVFFIFTHFIKHFYKKGINLRQVCDWCRLIWSYKDSLNHKRLESWICRAGLMEEWKTFAAFAVDCLWMPKEEVPMYDASAKWSRKAKSLVSLIVNGDVSDTFSIVEIFPWKTMRYLPSILLNVNGLKIIERVHGK